MARRCVFCGKELGLLERDSLACGGVLQPACKDCYLKVSHMEMTERIEKALETGRAVEPETLRTFLEKEQARQAAAQEERKRKYDAGITCQRCGGPMLKCGRKYFNMGESGLFGVVARDGLMASFLELDLLACDQCGKVEFYLPGPLQQSTEEEQVTCPVCGVKHSAAIGCPRCAMDRATSGVYKSGTEKKTEKRPPWEK